MTKALPTPVTVFSFVGNPGCIRFPPAIRKASGVKRGDRLTLTVQDDGSLLLEKIALAGWAAAEQVQVEGCACQNPPASCGGGNPDVLTVGWSYVRLGEGRAAELGLAAAAPLRLVGEPGKITVAVHPDLRDLEGVPPVACPP
jgi:antitoxin component of MazEF toxin-antitoxin module